MKPPVYKTVTTKEQMFFVDTNKENWNIGCVIHTTNSPFETIKGIDKNYHTQPGYEWLITVDGSGNQYKPCEIYGKVVAQPLESNLSGIPYYELTPQEEVVEQLAEKEYPLSSWKLQTDFAKGAQHGFIKGYKAAKAKGEFTEADVMNAWQVGFNIGSNYEDTPSYLTANLTTEDFIKTLRQPMKIVSAEPVIKLYDKNEGLDRTFYAPKTYTKPEHPGKTFISLTNIKYE